MQQYGSKHFSRTPPPLARTTLVDGIKIQFFSEYGHVSYEITVSHFSYAPFFQGPHFLTKMLESNILLIIYLMTFYLFDDIEKKIL